MPAASAFYFADIPNRAIALLVDVILLTLVAFVGAAIVSLLAGPAVEFDTAAEGVGDAVELNHGVATLDACLSLVLSAGYFALSWVRLNASPGQRLIGIRVAADGDRAGITAGQAMARWTALGAPFAVAAVLATALSLNGVAIFGIPLAAWYAVLLITTARSSTKQGLHDRLAGTIVAKRATPLPPSAADAL